jgi:hypothetical protein
MLARLIGWFEFRPDEGVLKSTQEQKLLFCFVHQTGTAGQDAIA